MRFRLKSEQGAWRTLSPLPGSQGSLVLKEIFAFGRDSLSELWQAREFESRREENLGLS